MRIYLTILFSIFVLLSQSQTICLNVDSISVYRIPWRVRSVYDIHKNELIRKEFKKNVVYKTITDSSILQSFLRIDLIDTSRVDKNDKIKSADNIDARVALVLYFNTGLTDTLVCSKNGNYYYAKKYHLFNMKLLMWLYEYIPLKNKQDELFDEEEMKK